MQRRKTSTRWYELMIFYNVAVALAHAVVAIGVTHEALALGFGFVGNRAPVAGEEHHRLASLVIMHYYTTMFELTDTFFLIARKKIG